MDVKGLRYYDELLFTPRMIADFHAIDERTIKRYIQDHGDELRANGYFLSEGNSLKELKLHFCWAVLQNSLQKKLSKSLNFHKLRLFYIHKI